MDIKTLIGNVISTKPDSFLLKNVYADALTQIIQSNDPSAVKFSEMLFESISKLNVSGILNESVERKGFDENKINDDIMNRAASLLG